MSNQSVRTKKKILSSAMRLILALSLGCMVASCSDQEQTSDNSEVKEYQVSKENETITTDSGLKYEIITKGTGATPAAIDSVTVHYEGKLLDGTVFDSSYERGETISFPLGGVIKGWTEGLQLMQEGAKYIFTIPSELAYGEAGAGASIPPNADLIFTVELIKVDVNEDIAFLEANKAKDGIKVTESGLQYKVLLEGSGKSPKDTDNVTVHYEGSLIDGTVFDSSYKRGEVIDFPLNRVISGWTEGLQLMKEGATYKFFIPSELGYGRRGSPGSIPPNATLIFKVELIRVN